MASETARTLGIAALTGFGLALLAGCGTSSSPDSGATPVSSVTGPGNLTTGPSTAPVSRPSTSPGDVTLTGSVSGDGLTCVRFVTSDGGVYSLAGPGLSDKITAVAHSRGRRSAISAAPGQTQVAAVTLVGHPVKGAMSTCNATVFSVTSATVRSVTTK